jgi:hypothetical protein
MQRVSSPGALGVVQRVAGGSAVVHDRGVLPVTPLCLWCLVPGNQSGAGGDLAGWVLSPSMWFWLTFMRLVTLCDRSPGYLVLVWPFAYGAISLGAC